MTGAIITREARSNIWSALRPLGFSVFSARTAWRYNKEKIDIVNVQSFTADMARGLGVTSFSFSVNLSCYLTYIPPEHAPRLDKGRIAPHEAECWFRHRVTRLMEQPENANHDVWSILPLGENLPWCIDDAKQQLVNSMSWFDLHARPEELLANLLCEPGSPTTGIFSNPSPKHSYITGYVALRCGQIALARQYFERAVASQCYPHFFNSVEGAMYRSKYGHRAP